MITIRDMETEAENGCSAFDAADQLRDYVYELTRQAFAHSKTGSITDVQKAGQRKDFVQKRFLEAIGGLAGESPPLSASVTGTLPCEGYRIEKIIFQSVPQVWVSANLYLPDTSFPGRKLPQYFWYAVTTLWEKELQNTSGPASAWRLQA